MNSSVRIRIFDINPADRGVGNEICVIYDAKNIGSEVYANDVGSAFWTLPVDHPLVPDLIPLRRHYKIERKSGNNWVLIGAGLLSAYDATNDEIVYEGMDYMTMMSMHYTKLVGPESGSETAIQRPEADSTSETIDTTIYATRSASVFTDGSADPKLWNANDAEKHIPLGVVFSTASIIAWSLSSTTARVTYSGVSTSFFAVNDYVFIYGNAQSRINGTRQITAVGTLSATSGYFDFTTTAGSSGGGGASGTVTFARYVSRGFVKFELPANLDVNSTVTKADLILYQTNESGDHTIPDTTPGDLRIRRVNTNDWTTEQGVGAENSWGNAGNTLDWSTMSGDTVSASEVSYNSHTNVHLTKITASITSIVDDWKDTPALNKGLQLRNTDESIVSNGFTLASTKYSASYRPALALTYTAVTNPATNVNVNGLSHGPKATKALVKQRSANSSSRHDGKEIAIYCKNAAGEPNELDLVYDETDQSYLLSGTIYIERSAINDAEKLYDAEADNYVPNRFNIESIRLAVVANPGEEVCTINVWPGSWTQVGTPETPAQFKWQLKLRQHDSAVAEDLDPAASVPTLSTVSGVYGNFASTTLGSEVVTNSYEINCLTSGVQYNFSVLPLVELAVVSPQTSSTNPDYGGTGAIHDLNGILASTNPDDSAIMGLKSETLEDIFTEYVSQLDNAGGAYSRFGWILKETASGQAYSAGLLRYFTSGQSVLEFLRDMCEKEMAANLITTDDANRRWDVIDDVKVPWRAVFNFVGVRGASYPGTRLCIAPAKSDSSPRYLFDYPGNIDVFRYRRDGKKLRNSVRIVPSTSFLTGSTTTSSGSRSQGKLAENSASIQEYGYAPILTTQANFADETELQKYADSQLIKLSDILNVSMANIQIGPDTVRPFEDFFLGDIVQVAIRRKNVNFSDPINPDLMTDAYVVGGIRFELPVDGSERITVDLVKASDFGRG